MGGATARSPAAGSNPCVCKAQWDDRYFSSQPQCNDKVLPTIAFYDRSNNNYDGDSLCTINLNEAEDGNIENLCPELDSILNASFEGDLKMFSTIYLYYIIIHSLLSSWANLSYLDKHEVFAD